MEPNRIEPGSCVFNLIEKYIFKLVIEESGDEMEAGGTSQNLYPIPTIQCQSIDNSLSPFHIMFSHFSHVSEVMAFSYKFRQSQLAGYFIMQITLPFTVSAQAYQLRREYHVSYSDGGTERFTEGADIYNPLRTEPMQGTEWWTVKTKFAVVIIFYDVASCPFGIVQ